MNRRTFPFIPLLICLLLLAACSRPASRASGADLSRDPLVPTPLPGPHTQDNSEAGAVAAPGEAIQNPKSKIQNLELPEPGSLRWRVGVGVPDGKSPLPYAWPDPRPGWYLNWSVGFTETMSAEGPSQAAAANDLPFVIPPDAEAGMQFAPMINVPEGTLVPPPTWITAVAQAMPGRTWLVGNEPDVRWQDNVTAERYADAYHTAYTAIKAGDPSASVAIAGLSQITPLRLAYLDRVWAAYQEQYGEPMPVDVWTMHAFVLQEKAGDWGVDMPPGFEASRRGEMWTIDQHDDLGLVEEQVRRMRTWMAEHGQQDKPLWITEFGILMPPEYGFDADRVRRFLINSFDLFDHLTEPGLGLATDGDRLVQRWVWYSTDDYRYPTGNLFTDDGAPTTIMNVLHAYLENFAVTMTKCECSEKQ